MSIKHLVEYAILRTFVSLIQRLPQSWAYAFMERVTLGIHSIFGWRKQSTIDRISTVCARETPEKQTWIRKEAVRNLGRNLTELIRNRKMDDVEIEGMEETFRAFDEARKKEKGILLVIVHSGNWDLAGVRTVQEGFPMCFIARQQKNSLTYQMLVDVREQNGGTVVDRDDPKLIRKLITFLADNGIVAVLIDIRARQAGDQFEYLGQEAWLANGLGLLAAKSKAEVVPVFLGRRGRDRHVWKPLPARRFGEEKPSKEERNALLQSCLDDLGAEVLKNPESYFWFNKRWVLEKFEEE
ncbi:lysophospholipid acyltransferase family protein [Kiritimatiellaeota bacterium B1221]|nr:lysophospholipid acyltransferase family protein [Kiritimatiellaeota bacterium B1221]